MKLSNMGLTQWSEVAVALQKAGFTEELLLQVINCPSNVAAYEMFKAACGALRISVPLFGLPVSEFKFYVPADYDHDEQMAKILLLRDQFNFFNDELCNIDAAEMTMDRLKPGIRYCAEFIPVAHNMVGYKEAVSFLQKKNALFVGIQGLFLLWNKYKHHFPKPAGRIPAYLVSLCNDNTRNYLIAPFVSYQQRDNQKEWVFNYFDHFLDQSKKYYFLCVTECQDS